MRVCTVLGTHSESGGGRETANDACGRECERARARDARSTYFVRLVPHQIHVLSRDVDRVDFVAELRDQLRCALHTVLVVAHLKTARVGIVAVHHRRIPSAMTVVLPKKHSRYLLLLRRAQATKS